MLWAAARTYLVRVLPQVSCAVHEDVYECISYRGHITRGRVRVLRRADNRSARGRRVQAAGKVTGT